jgi:hypothetical protein
MSEMEKKADVTFMTDTQFNSEGLRRLQRGDYKWCKDWWRGGDVSCHLLVTHDCYELVECFIHGSGGLHLLVQPLLHLLEPFFVHGRGVDDFQRLLQRGNRG